MSKGAPLMYADTRTVQAGDGCNLVTIPKDLVEAFDIESGDELLFSVQQGDEGILIRPAEQFRPQYE